MTRRKPIARICRLLGWVSLSSIAMALHSGRGLSWDPWTYEGEEDDGLEACHGRSRDRSRGVCLCYVPRM